ncbi:MAG: type IV pilus secretin PilQ [Desulfobacterales bacterium]|nr:type IV pilus secretin PilQ [Desulfobacterales bacterium]
MDVKPKSKTIFLVKLIAIIFLITSNLLLLSCSSKKSVKDNLSKIEKQDEISSISDISVSEDEKLISVIIKGDKPLVCSSFISPAPLAVSLSFQKTVIKNLKSEYKNDNKIFTSIKPSIVKGKANTAKVEILLKKVTDYKVQNEGSIVKVLFKKDSSVAQKPEETKENKNIDSPKSLEQEDLKYASQATKIESISANSLQDSAVVDIKANGIIKDYKTFIIDEPAPARIVYDLFNLKAPLKNEKIINIDSKWLQRVRYFGYPDKVRLVIETKKDYTGLFSDKPVSSGLLISAGNNKEIGQYKPIPQSSSQIEDKKNTPKHEIVEKNAAWINRIDFLSEEKGKSTLVIGTTRLVDYKIKKVADKKLLLQLFNTNIPDFRKRPLVTTRFECAVDRIVPFQAADKNATMVGIDLRETVPYMVKQDKNNVIVHFEPSSKPPIDRKSEDVALWKNIVMETSTQEEKSSSVKEKGQAISAASNLGDQPLIEGTSKYKGEKIALDFYDTDIKNVFRILKQVSGKNFAIDKDVSGKVTLSFEKPVPWDQVLDLILKMNQLGMVFEGDIIRIATAETIKKDKAFEMADREAKQKERVQKKVLEPIATEYISINYAQADADILPHVEKIIDKERGKVSVDKRTNMIIITDSAETIKRAKEIVNMLDQPKRQVIIEAKIVEASTSFVNGFGITWDNSSLGIQPTDPKAGVGPQRGYDALGGTYGLNFAVNLPGASVGTLGFNFIRSMGSQLVLNAKLMAMESQGEGKIISAPKILTLDKEKASIKQGIQYPYNKVDQAGNTTTTFQDINLVLDVEPRITDDGRISMVISVNKNDIGAIINNQQSFTTKAVSTRLLINDGDTVVIGGIIKATKSDGTSGLPGISKVPFLGWLFKNFSHAESKEELLIFITPTIVQLEQNKGKSSKTI